MKKRIYSLIAAFALVGSMAAAQDYKDDPKYGADPAAREQNVRILNFFGDAYRAKDYNTATNYLRQLIQNAPQASENMYIRGVDIYRNKAAAAETKEERRAMVDSILWIYDKRIEAFGEHPERGEGFLRGEKAKLFMSMMPADRERLFKLFREAIDGEHPFEPGLAVMYFNTVVESFKLDDVTPEELIETYERLSQRIATNTSEEAKEAAKALDDLFATSGAADCASIEQIYKPKYEADPTNQQLIETILSLLNRGGCSSDFYLSMLEKYYEVNPKPEVAIQLASVFQEKKDFTKAMEYLTVGIEKETDPAKKANFLLQAATMSSANGAYREAAGFARKAIELDSNNGVAYLLLGAAYGSGAGSACSAFDSQTAMWLAVDNLSRARQLLPEDDPQQQQISQMIANYSANFPKTEETFMRGLNPGDSYTVSCGWISGATTVRER